MMHIILNFQVTKRLMLQNICAQNVYWFRSLQVTWAVEFSTPQHSTLGVHCLAKIKRTTRLKNKPYLLESTSCNISFT
jgi:hypothetical protein